MAYQQPTFGFHVEFPGDANVPSTFDITITSSTLGAGYAIDTLYDGWCMDNSTYINVPGDYTAVMYSSYEVGVLANSPLAGTSFLSANFVGNLDNINWLLNFYTGPDSGYSWGEVQGAIWNLVGQHTLAGDIPFLGAYDEAKVTTLISLALASGDNYVPEAGQALGVIIDNIDLGSGQHFQPLIFETKAAALGDFVWNDINANGIQDAGEAGISGVTVNLVRDLNGNGGIDAGEILATTTTDSTGHYSFKGLTPGLDYQVEFVQPTGFDGVSPRQADASAISGSNSDGLLSNVVVLAPGENNTSIDAGFYKTVVPASLGDRLWIDANGNGLQDSGEVGIAGQTVTLIGGGADGIINGIGDTVATTTTGADGVYSFAGLTPGQQYQVQFSAPAGTVFTAANVSANTLDSVDSDADATGKTQIVTLAAGENNTTLDAGIYTPAVLSGYVYQDAGNDGVRNAEPGIAGVVLTLSGTDGAGNPVTGTAITDANGHYSFTNLAPGSYTVSEAQPTDYLDGQDTVGSTGGSNAVNDVLSNVTLVSGASSVENNFGEIKPATITGVVYHDVNNDGLHAGEAGIPGATVTLTGTNDLGLPVTVTAVTAADGSYSFTGLRPGTYTVTETQPAGYLDGKDTAGAGATVASNDVISVVLGQGQSSTENNFGEVKAASIAGVVFFDANNDGLHAGDAGIAGTTVTLTGLNDLGQSVSVTQATAADGSYLFAGLRPGSYTVSETQPAGYLDGKDTAGTIGGVTTGSAAVNDVVSAIVLKSGDASVENNFGEIKPGAITGVVYHDVNNDGLHAGEAGIPGATVTLTGTNDLGIAVTVTAVTAADGSYSFTGLRPGTYTVTETQPAGYLDGKDTAGAGATVASNDVISVVLGQGQSSTENNFGEVKAASIAGVVFFDANNDGLHAGDAGIAGTTVTLTGLNDLGQSVSVTQATAADGSYLFAGLRPGSYTVSETQPAGYLDGKDTAGTIGGVTTGSAALNDVVSAIVLKSGDASVENNFGEIKPGAITGVVYHDVNNDGLHAGEAGIPGATVTLTGTNDLGIAVTVTAVTAADGSYSFTGLRPGTYTVTETQPAGYLDGKDTAGAGATVASNDVISVVLGQGQSSTENNFGEVKAASIAGVVFFDANNDGLHAGDAGIAGTTVTLTGLNDLGQSVSVTQATAADGSYLFAGLRPGSYTVSETQPAGYLDGKDTAGTIGGVTTGSAALNDVVSAIVLKSGDASVENNFGEIKPGAITGVVYHDVNNDGLHAGEAGIPGATVTLTGTNDLGIAVTVTAVTAADGSYSFTGLRPGTYTVTETQPAGYLDGKDTAGAGATVTGNDAIQVVLGQGQSSTENNFGEVKAASIAGVVFFDANNDGLHAGDAGIAGTTVTLTGLNDLGQSVSVTQATAADGSYLFAGLRPGSYTVSETQPAGYLDGKDTAGTVGGVTTGSAAVNDVVSAIVLKSGDASVENNFGEIKPATVSGFVYVDANNDGLHAGDAGIPGATVTLTGTNDLGIAVTLTATTDANGAYSFTNLRPGTYAVTETQPAGYLDGKDTAGTIGGVTTGSAAVNDIVSGIVLKAGDASVENNFGEIKVVQKAHLGDFVWNDLNANGVQDVGETGIAGVTVSLKDTTGTIVATTTTDATGKYGFDVAPGTYTVQFTTPTGYVVTTKDASGNTLDTTDSDISSTGATGSYTLASGDNNLSIDAGYYKLASLGDRIWYDKNANGIQDAGEVGVAGVKLDLINNATGTIVGTTTTDANGNYLFTNLTPGSFHVDVQEATLPTGFIFTKANQGSNDALDSDVETLSNSVPLIWGIMANTTLTSGENDLTWDAGVYKVGIDVQKYVSGTTSTTLAACGGEGGSVSYWKSECSWQASLGCNGWGGVVGCKSTDSFNTVFGVNCSGGTKSIYDVLCGTSTASIDVFQRECVAAYLNASHNGCNYSYSKDEVCAQVKYAVGCGDYTTTCNAFGSENSQGGNFHEGASVSYWKSNCTYQSALGSNGWTGTSCKATDSFNKVFGVSCANGTKSIYDVLCGTSTATIDVTMRECVAAYLNSCHNSVDYNYTTAQVCSQVKTCFSGTSYSSTCDLFSTENNLGCNWTTTKACYSNVVDTQLYDANSAPGLEVATGSVVTFTYIVKNTGDTALKDVVLTDDRIASVTYLSGDTNGNGLLDTTETWTYKATEVAQAGTIKNIGTVTATDSVGAVAHVTASDPAYYTGTSALKGSIGDRVWLDSNANGIQDAGETGISGIKVTLKGAGKDGLFGTADDTTATTTTAANGAYLFANLDAGKYQVVLGSTTGYTVTKQNQGSNDAVDSDIDTTGTTAVITLGAGEQNLTVDAGLYQKASVGDKVFEDWNHNNIQDVGEGGISGITVKLLSSTGAVLATTKTDTNGNYLFSNLDPGAYTLQFDKSNVIWNDSHWGGSYNMNAWKWAVKDVGTNDAIDSDVTGDATATTNVTVTSQFTLVSGQNDMTKDAGITPIVINLDGHGIQTISRADSTGTFDLFGNGQAVTSGWIANGSGFLAVDKNGNGKIDDISELFGGTAKGAGFAQLASYDSNGDGVVDAKDTDFNKLLIWQDLNGNHSTDAGELMTLAQAGIASLTVGYTELPFIDAQGNLHLERSSATLSSGTSVSMTDVYFNVSADDAKAAGVTLPSMADLLGSNTLDTVVGAGSTCTLSPVSTAHTGCDGTGAGDAGEALRRIAMLTRDESHQAAV